MITPLSGFSTIFVIFVIYSSKTVNCILLWELIPNLLMCFNIELTIIAEKRRYYTCVINLMLFENFSRLKMAIINIMKRKGNLKYYLDSLIISLHILNKYDIFFLVTVKVILRENVKNVFLRQHFFLDENIIKFAKWRPSYRMLLLKLGPKKWYPLFGKNHHWANQPSKVGANFDSF